LAGKIKIAQGIDGNIGQKFQSYSKYGETISKTPEELIKLIPNQNNAENSSNNELLQKIQKENIELVKSIEVLKSIATKFGDQITSLNFTQEAMNAKKNNISFQQVFENYEGKFLQNFKDLVFHI
jgi:hypothetical protein